MKIKLFAACVCNVYGVTFSRHSSLGVFQESTGGYFLRLWEIVCSTYTVRKIVMEKAVVSSEMT